MHAGFRGEPRRRAGAYAISNFVPEVPPGAPPANIPRRLRRLGTRTAVPMPGQRGGARRCRPRPAPQMIEERSGEKLPEVTRSGASIEDEPIPEGASFDVLRRRARAPAPPRRRPPVFPRSLMTVSPAPSAGPWPSAKRASMSWSRC